MAKLSDEVLTQIFQLLRSLAEGIEEASATEWLLFSRYGENNETVPELEELQSTRERLTVPYSRLNTLILRIVESQPTSDPAMLDLLFKTMEQAEASVAAAKASVIEVKRVWTLP